MSKVYLHEHLVHFSACVELMDDELRERIHEEYCVGDQRFLDIYCDLHEDKFEEEFNI
jgi:hypothetical protein